MRERGLSMLHAATLLTRSGIHGYGLNRRKTWIKVPLKGRSPALEGLMEKNGAKSEKEAVRSLLSKVEGTVLIEEIKPPQPLPEAPGMKPAQPGPKIRNPIALLIRFL
jgi:hypothetical protein